MAYGIETQFHGFDSLLKKLESPGVEPFLRRGLVRSGAAVVKSSMKNLYKPSSFPSEIHGLNTGTLRRGIRIGEIKEGAIMMGVAMKWMLEVGVFNVPYARWIEEGEANGYKPKGNTTGGRKKGVSRVGLKVTKYIKRSEPFMGYHYMDKGLKDSFATCLIIMKQAYSDYIESIKI